MANQLDILIKRARLRRREGLFDIGIAGGVISAIEPSITQAAEVELDAEENLTTESFANTHLHLDKVYTLAMMDEQALKSYHGESMGKAMTAIELASRVKASYATDWIVPNVHRALKEAARYGNTHIRAFADVDSKAKLIGVEALLEAREAYAGVVDVQIVAFPQDGVVREPGTVELIEEAVRMGAEVVGGIPWIEYTDADAQTHVDQMVRIATANDRHLSMLVDDAGDPGLRTLEMFALAVSKAGMQGRGLAHHARAMQLYPKPYFQKIAALLKQAGMGVVSDPHTGPLHARVGELLEEGVVVCLGQDDISDAYYPFGRNNMLEVAFLASHLLWMTTAAEMEILYDMVTTEAARAMNVETFRLAVAHPAHLVVLDQPSVLEALRYHAAPRHVVSHGKLVHLDNLPG